MEQRIVELKLEAYEERETRKDVKKMKKLKNEIKQ